MRVTKLKRHSVLIFPFWLIHSHWLTFALVSRVWAKASGPPSCKPSSSPVACWHIHPVISLHSSPSVFPRRSWWMGPVYEAAATAMINQVLVTVICCLEQDLQSIPDCGSKEAHTSALLLFVLTTCTYMTTWSVMRKIRPHWLTLIKVS